MLTLLSVGVALRFLRFLQVPPLPPAPDVMAQFGQLIQAWEGKQWVLVGALFIGLVVAASKSGWLGNWLATKIPPTFRPVLALVVGVLSVSSTEVIAGVDWKLALLHAVYAAATAVLGHQVFVEGMRKGKEFVPIAKWSMRPPPPPPPPAAGGSMPLAPPPKMPTGTGPIIKFSEMGCDDPSRVASLVRDHLKELSRRTVVTRSFAFGFMALALQGCAAASAWWQQFLANPAATIGALVTYIQGFLTAAQNFWSVFIAPSLGANSASATSTFNNVIVTASNSLTALQEAVQAAVIAKNQNPDFSALIAAVQDAVAQIFTIIQKWQPASQTAERAEAFASANDSITHQAKQIAAWGHK